MKTLGIDTANQTMSVALFDNKTLLANYVLNVKKNHSLTLMPAIDTLLKDADLKPHDLAKIIVVKGPGSYTGVRIGVVAAKTLAYTLKIPLFAVSSLSLIAVNAFNYPGKIVPLIDARRENVYAGIFQFQKGELQQLKPNRHISLTNLCAKLKGEARVLFMGEAVTKFKQKLSEELNSGEFCTNFLWNVPNSSNLALLEKVIKPVTNLFTFTPEYLKLVEAEENWLKQQGSEHIADYQKTQRNFIEKI